MWESSRGDIAFRRQTYKLDQTLENAMKPEPLLAYAMNGDLNAVIARDRKSGGAHQVLGFVLRQPPTVQPVAAGLSLKKTFVQDTAEFPRKVMIS